MIQHTQITPYNCAKVNFELLKTPDGKLGMANTEVGIFVLVTVGMTLLWLFVDYMGVTIHFRCLLAEGLSFGDFYS